MYILYFSRVLKATYLARKMKKPMRKRALVFSNFACVHEDSKTLCTRFVSVNQSKGPDKIVWPVPLHFLFRTVVLPIVPLLRRGNRNVVALSALVIPLGGKNLVSRNA